MKPTILCTLLTLFIFNTVNAADFRKLNWGATTQQIIEAEGKKPDFKEKGVVFFRVSLNGIDGGAIYKLENNKLKQGIYMLKADGTDGLRMLDQYETLDKLLEKKYGKASRQDRWVRTKYKSSPEKHGTELRLGYLIKNTTFKTERNIIFHTMGKGGGKIKHELIYESRKGIEDAKKKSEAQALDAL